MERFDIVFHCNQMDKNNHYQLHKHHSSMTVNTRVLCIVCQSTNPNRYMRYQRCKHHHWSSLVSTKALCTSHQSTNPNKYTPQDLNTIHH